MIYTYARVSTGKQDLKRQIDLLEKEYPGAKLYVDKCTGTRLDRLNFKKLLKSVKKGDTIVFEAVDRMSRNADEGAALYAELYKKGVELVFLKNPNINTSVYREQITRRVQLETDRQDATGRFINGLGALLNDFIVDLAAEQVKLAFVKAEEENKVRCGRIKEGIRVRKERGDQVGRVAGLKYKTKKEVETKKEILAHSKTFGGSLKDTEIMKLCRISRNSYYKYKAELIAEQNGEKTALDIVAEI